MRDILHIKNGSYHAEIDPDKLPGLQLPKIRKLFRLMFAASWENAEAIEKLEILLPEEVITTQEEWKKTKTKFAKARYDRWLKIKSIYEMEKEKYER